MIFFILVLLNIFLLFLRWSFLFLGTLAVSCYGINGGFDLRSEAEE